MSDVVPRPAESSPPRWQPIAALDRRVLGVLVEKAKTTPDGYPMSINALRSGCNQKNNRFPLMEVEPEDVEESLDRLRGLGAVAEVQGGRVARYRHYMYEWLGVDKVELAVMAELLLRGAQTEGELRGRAARMEPIADVSALRPVLLSLKSKGLIVSLTPEGRGHVVTHALYQPREMEKLQAEFSAMSPPRDLDESPRVAPSSAHASPYAAQAPAYTPQPAHIAPPAAAPPASTAVAPPGAHDGAWASRETVDQLRREIDSLRDELASVRKDLDDLWSNFR